MDLELVGFASKKKRNFAYPYALEFAMTIVMLYNNDQSNVKIPKAQLHPMAANETVHYFVVTI